MIWLTARIAESSAYLLFEPQPAMNRPTISSDETARKNSTPMSRSATPIPGANGIVAKISRHGHEEDDRREVEDGPVGRARDHVFLQHQLHASAIGCSRPCGPTRYGPMRDCMRAANLRSSSVT